MSDTDHLSAHFVKKYLFKKNTRQNSTLLYAVYRVKLKKNNCGPDTNWAEVSPKLKKKSLKTTILQYVEVCGETLKGKKKDEAVVKTKKICQVS